MPSEKRTRVEFFLPIRTDASDYRTITDWLAEELAYSRGGSRLTSPFTGLYVSGTRGSVIREMLTSYSAIFFSTVTVPKIKQSWTPISTMCARS